MTDTTPDPAETRVLQRLIMPIDHAPDVSPLYVEVGASRGTAQGGAFGLGGESETAPQDVASSTGSVTSVGREAFLSRHAVCAQPNSVLSFGTYFNAFPASYWRRWTPVREIGLDVTTSGQGTLIVYRSNPRGAQQRVSTHEVGGSFVRTSITLPLTAFGDGGWYWFDVYAGAESLTVESATWSADASLARTRGTFSIGMTTLNKVSYCLDNIATIARTPEVRELLDTMYIVDQGSDRLTDHPDELAPLQQELGEQLQIIPQGNIGGSGGFSRGMYEAATNGRSTYVVNCDDDIVIEPETLLRLVTFGDFATRPTLVGAHMFDLHNRSVMHTFGEIVDPWRTQPALPGDQQELGHDFRLSGLRETDWLHRRVDVDYNGWWCCLIPTEVVREIGLALPVFIKWDDAEYGLRAKKAGYPTVSLPGAAVWHVSWIDKDDLVGWQAFFHERNRLITALLHSPYERGGRVVPESQFLDVKHIISMQYYTEEGRLRAQEDLLRGPDHLHETIGTTLPQIRAMASEYDDAVAQKDVDEFPAPYAAKPPRRGRGFSMPARPLLVPWTAKTLAKHLAVPPKETAAEHPETIVAHQDSRWWRLAHYDSALVSNAEGTTVSWYRRRPEQARAMFARAMRNHARLAADWPRLRARYRAAAPGLTSFEAWERTFAANTPDP